jgi:hypothetical protein
MAENQKVTPDEIRKIRSLADFDLIMLISEIHDHGWPLAARTLQMMPPNPTIPPPTPGEPRREEG